MPYLMLAFLSMLWGTSFLLIKIASGAFDPFAFAFGRMAIGAAALVLVAAVAGWRWPRERRVWGILVVIALVGQATPVMLLGAAARLTTSADLALMMGAAPVATILVARLFGLGEVWSARAAFGIALGVAGLALAVSAPVDADLYPHAAWGRVYGLAAAVLYAVGALISRSASRRIGPAMAAAASAPIAAVALLTILLTIDGAAAPAQFLSAPAASIEALLALGTVNTALAYLVYFRLVATSGATFAALNNYIVPFIGLILGAALLVEPVALSSWAGLGLVVAGVVLTGAASRPAIRTG